MRFAEGVWISTTGFRFCGVTATDTAVAVGRLTGLLPPNERGSGLESRIFCFVVGGGVRGAAGGGRCMTGSAFGLGWDLATRGAGAGADPCKSDTLLSTKVLKNAWESAAV